MTVNHVACTYYCIITITRIIIITCTSEVKTINSISMKGAVSLLQMNNFSPLPFFLGVISGSFTADILLCQFI